MSGLSRAERALLIQLADPAAEVPPAEALAPCLDRILGEADYHRVLPSAMVRLPDGLADRVPAATADRLRADAGRMMVLRATGADLLSALEAAGIPAVIVKGERFAAQLYPAPLWRPYTDIDLLLPRAAMARTATLLAERGYRAGSAPVKHAGGYAEEKWVRRIGAVDVLVELHWDMINSPSLRRGRHLGFQDVTDGSGGMTPVGDLLVACVHATLGHTFERLTHIIDIAQAARGVGGQIDPSELADRARACGLQAAVGLSLGVAARVLEDRASTALLAESGLPPPPSWPVRLLSPRAAVTRRGGHDPLVAWRRPLVREWLKRRGTA